MSNSLPAPLYRRDLADIQAEVYGAHVEASGAGLLELLARGGITGGRVVDLGCGAGEWLARLLAAGYDAVGVEPSEPLCAHARRRAPGARLQRACADDADLRGARAVTALGEVFNYLPPSGRARPLHALFRRIARVLPENGMLLFDMIVAGTPALDRRTWVEGEGWLMLVEMREDPDRRRSRAERRVTVFRQAGDGWRRSDEVHRLRIPASAEVVAALREAGFAVRTRSRWHLEPLLPRRLAFIARRRSLAKRGR